MRVRACEVISRERGRALLFTAAWLLVLTRLLLLSAPAQGEDSRYLRDEKTFTAYIAQLMTRALPTAKTQIKGPLTLVLEGLPNGGIQMNLDSLYSYCRRAPDDCDPQTQAYIARAATSFRKMMTPLQAGDLRAVIRDNAYIKNTEKLYDDKLIAEPLIGDLWTLCVVDMPGAMRILSVSQLPELKLSASEALALCKKNAAATLPPLEPAKRDYPWAGVNIVTGDPYDAGWMIFPDRWTGIAESLQGDLLVAAPGVDILLYASGAAPDSVAALGKAAAIVAAKAQKPLSTAVFRWTPTGWEEAQP